MRWKYEVHVLAELNGTTPKAIQEIIDRMAEQEGVEVTDREDNPVDKLEKQAERQRKQSREYKRRVRAEERAAKAETEETKEEQKKMTEEEKKAKKAAYMKKYWERKKAEREAEKSEEAPAPLEVVDPEEPDTEETEPDNGDNDELIKKAVQYFSEDLAEAIYEQRLKIEEEKSKLRKMEDDLERCKRILGFGKEEVAENVCD
jgi:hypothetical protein